ncbi:MBL fold metallo-hydrolase [Mycolicibacterium mucogenicum]|uniref:MBL fold metallo-hydrolase n=1 Tax=Mycolicibacterium mucogenicum DSM 44124 TaxID=1226753 RepID=A0A8H2JAD5_MYCMU|nr:MBL fold metallo-hydrolase [Mycolicibacterium mucogenicum]KAB7761359.1 beta-lactamase [Mycolicibacterium mucogenicum DSM 44124]QPG70184.1 MBL fold metallo-hydrolase [Mycolicibacterium mucogenicum DSM 44124]
MSALSTSGVDPGCELITDRVVRVPLPLPLPGLTSVNAYLILGANEVTLIDPGWDWTPAETALCNALHGFGAGPSDVRQILVTHQHWDHYSLALRWSATYGAELMLGHEERHSIESFATVNGVHPTQVGMLMTAGAPRLARAVEGLRWESYELGIAFTAPDRWLTDGDVIDCGGTSVVARFTPGHTRGHMVFDDVADGMVFTGDHLLPRITPSIAFERAPEALPLQSYLSSLELFLELPQSRMLPAHGPANQRTGDRAQELLDHHRQRLELVAEFVAAGPCTAFDVAAQMRWTRHERALGDLDVVHQMTAVLEVAAHLDLLATQHILTHQDEADGRVFTVA